MNLTFLLLSLVGTVFSEDCTTKSKGSGPALCDKYIDKLCGNSSGVEQLVCTALDELCRYIICNADDVAHHLPLIDVDSDFYSGLWGKNRNGKVSFFLFIFLIFAFFLLVSLFFWFFLIFFSFDFEIFSNFLWFISFFPQLNGHWEE